ncbi:MAG: hypothetical protein K6T90_02210 [Leptolyngbyaceae cyanobacterium HOT.MB2.61]|nr:hypothetical protein [Leptolyngbyaceae cyanobacterium HOT.MB2.61]
MTYKKVQFIAYCIHTGPKTIGLKQQYLGIAPTSADIAERIKLVRKAIEVARTNSNTKQSDDETLKIFMMPEFFFRGKEGAYALELITGIQRKSRTWLEWLKGGFLSDLSRLTGYSQPRVEEIGLIGLLQNLVKDQQWKNWIFVFGSIIGSSVETDITDREEVYNLVLVQKGGFGDTPRVGSTFAKVVMKEHVSGMDFIKTSESGGGALLERVFHPLTVNQQQLVKHLKDLLALTEEQLRAAPISFTESEIALWRTSEKARLNDCLTPNSSPQFLPHFLFGLRSGDAYFSALFPLIEKFLKAKLGNVKAQELLLSIRRSEEQQKEYDGSSVFEIDGIRFGLEVCLDHGVRRLKNSKNLPTIDIQLVPSCGAQINEDAIVAKTNGYGYIFHCDGYADYDANWLGYNSGAKRVRMHTKIT